MIGPLNTHSGSKFGLQCKERGKEGGSLLVSAPSIIMQWNSRREGGEGGSATVAWGGFSMGNFQRNGIDRRKAAADLCGIVVRETEGGEFWVNRGSRP